MVSVEPLEHVGVGRLQRLRHLREASNMHAPAAALAASCCDALLVNTGEYVSCHSIRFEVLCSQAPGREQHGSSHPSTPSRTAASASLSTP